VTKNLKWRKIMSDFVTLQEENVLVLKGAVTATNVMAIRKAGEDIISKLSKDGIIDLSAVSSAGAVTLSLLLAWLRAAKSRNMSLVVRKMPDRLFDMVRVSGLELVLPFDTSS
jgi:phospholipid transport system transporter-binding protein